MKKKLLTIYFFAFINTLNSQTLSIDNIQKVSLQNSDAIREKNEIKGYYFFYVSDKIDKRTNEYTLQIVDNNLKKLKDIKFQDSKNVSVLECSFNGTDLVFLFYNSDEGTLEYKIYGTKGNLKHSYLRSLSKKDEAYLKAVYATVDDDEKVARGLYPVEGKGFLSNTPSREDGDYTFQIDFFSTEKRKQWTYSPIEGGKGFSGDYLGIFDGVVLIEVLRVTGIFDGKPDSYVIGLNLETGKKIFEKPTDARFRFYPSSLITLGEGNAYMFGEYFDKDANVIKDKSKGFAFWGINKTGQISSEKYISWDSDLAKFLNVNSQGKIEDFGYMFLHNMVQSADGNIYAIGEGFKKAVSALGIATKILTRSNISVTKMKITDLVILTFDKDFNLKEAKIYPKNETSIELHNGAEFTSTIRLGKIIKYQYGGFDYSYTTVNSDRTSFSICYSDYVKGKDYKGGTFNSITYNEGKFTVDKINTKTDASTSTILPGKQGQVLILDYYRKQKRIDVHFEKLN